MITSITLELFSASNCHRCTDAKKRIRAIIDEFEDGTIHYREIDVLDELDYAVSLGVLTTPTIAINGEQVFTGMPSLKRLRGELQKRLAAS